MRALTLGLLVLAVLAPVAAADHHGLHGRQDVGLLLEYCEWDVDPDHGLPTLRPPGSPYAYCQPQH